MVKGTDTLLAGVAILLAACSPAPVAAPITLHAGDPGPQAFAAGTYRVAWTTDCSDLSIAIAPTSGGPPIPVVDHVATGGSAVVSIPAGPAYVNRGGICPSGATYDVTISPAK